MGKLDTFDILLTTSAEHAVFTPGASVAGNVAVEFSAPIRIKEIDISLNGVAKVQWSEVINTGTRLGSSTENYHAEDCHLLLNQKLFGEEDDTTAMEVGKHLLPFKFQLPTRRLPTSFEGKCGEIRYWLEAEIHRPWAVNYRTKQHITVITPVDVFKPEYQMPIERYAEKAVCSMSCRTGAISLYARVNKRGYCAGETLRLTTELENHTGRSVLPQATLYQVQTYHANGRVRTIHDKLTTLQGSRVKNGYCESWDAEPVEIPPVSPSVNNCPLLRVRYSLKVAVHIPWSETVGLYIGFELGTCSGDHSHDDGDAAARRGPLTPVRGAPEEDFIMVGGSDLKFSPVYEYRRNPVNV